MIPIASGRLLEGDRVDLVVAPPGELDESQIRAFISAPDQGVNYARGTWHHPLLCLQHPGRFIPVLSDVTCRIGWCRARMAATLLDITHPP